MVTIPKREAKKIGLTASEICDFHLHNPDQEAVLQSCDVCLILSDPCGCDADMSCAECEENETKTRSSETAANITMCEICGEPRPNITRDALIKLGWCGATIDAETKTHKIRKKVTFCPRHNAAEVTDRMIKLILGDNVPTPNEAAKMKQSDRRKKHDIYKRTTAKSKKRTE